MINQNKISEKGKIVAFIDIGTNSLRLFIVRINFNLSYSVLTEQKESVRLGEGAFHTEVLTPVAIDRTITVCKRFIGLAKNFGVDEFIAVATAATREAHNKHEFLSRIHEETGLFVHVISGKEEARLIYLGIISGISLENNTALCLDIGGGSTEIAIGTKEKYLYLTSLKIGSIRLTNEFFSPLDKSPVEIQKYEEIRNYVKIAMIRALQDMDEYSVSMLIGSSGTLLNLAEIAQKVFPNEKGIRTGFFSLSVLKRIITLLCSKTLDERKKIPGINPERADIIIPGAIIVECVMDHFNISDIRVTNRSLKDGMLIDYLSKFDNYPLFGEVSVRERSVLQLARSCHINENHARTVTRLALELFDQSAVSGLHKFGEWERNLLHYASYLHDVGSFIAFSNHQNHSYYIIRNVELLGFDELEITIIATITRYHRKKIPGKKVSIPDIDEELWNTIKVLIMFLRLAESLDRSHAAHVHHIHIVRDLKAGIIIELISHEDCSLEIMGVKNEKKNFKRIFQISLGHRYVTLASD